MAGVRDIPKQLQAQWGAMDRRVRVGILVALGAVTVGLAVLLGTGGRVDYAPLYAGLQAEDASAVVEKLGELKIPYQLGRGGEVIEVPRAQVAEARLALASQGLPRGGAVGFELFDKQGLGVSDFVQRTQYHRALQGELERSIVTLAAVQRARVHLVVPEKTLFRAPSEGASASVVLQLRPGRALQPQQVQGIVHLIASSVDGLRPERVTVVDGRGEVLSQRSGAQAAATAALTYQREIEETAAKRAQELLERTLGKGHAAVQVSAQVDTSQVERTDENFSPEGQVVRSEQEVDDVVGATGEAGAEGVAGARANLPGGPPPQVAAAGGSHRRSQTRNYEISKVMQKVTQPVGRLMRLTVAVLVDGKYEAASTQAQGQGGPGGAAATKKFVPRNKEELDAYAAIVKEAVGFDAKRGDQVEVRCVPFAGGDTMDEAGAGDRPMNEVTHSPWLYAAGTAAILALLAGAGYALSRRRQHVQVLPAGIELPTRVEQLQASLAGEPRALPATPAESPGPSPLALRQQALEMLSRHPEQAAHVLRAWIHETTAEGEGEGGKQNPSSKERIL